MDVHKYAHHAVALNCLGQELSQLSFTNDELAHCRTWLNGLGAKPAIVVGLEDVNGVGTRLSQFLLQEGFTCRYVPAILTERERKHSVQHDKSDYLDAKRVGKVILTKSEETLPVSPILTQENTYIKELDLLLQERQELVREQTAVKNQLHVLLHQYYGNNYHQEFKHIFSQKALTWYKKDLRIIQSDTKGSALLAAAILRRVERLQLILSQVAAIDKTLNGTSKTISEVEVLTKELVGCGKLTACKIIVEVGTIQRFNSKDKLAKYAGIAPVRDQSSSKNRFYTNSGGNRKLNQAIHTVALSQIGAGGYEDAKKYFQKKVNEGKSKLWAIRCLKRQISNRIFLLLKNASNTKLTN